MVHPEHIDRRPADCRAADRGAALEAEMIVPFVPSRMVEPRHLAGRRVTPGQIRSLVSVAVVTRYGEIACGRGSAMLAGDDMVDLEGRLRTGSRQAAVFTPPARSLPYQSL